MRRKIAIWSVVIMSVVGCRTITANFPRDISSITLDNGINIKLELNEDIMVFLDPVVTKKLTIDYGKRQLEYRTTEDHYNFDIQLIKRDNDTVWHILADGWYSDVECSFTNENAQFETRYSRIPSEVIQDTLMWIKYKNFTFNIKKTHNFLEPNHQATYQTTS